MLDLLTVKGQMHIDADDTSEDLLLSRYLNSSKRAVANYVNRVVYWTELDRPIDPLPVPEYAIDASEDFELAVLLLVGHYYNNREAVTEANISQIPLGISFLLNPYRVINL
jgi:uncharacterized phage protein (predicted DNA packaging)